MIVTKLEQPLSFTKIEADEGKYLTMYKPEDDIATYYGTIVICGPSTLDVKSVREITANEHDTYMAEKESAIALKIEEENVPISDANILMHQAK